MRKKKRDGRRGIWEDLAQAAEVASAEAAVSAEAVETAAALAAVVLAADAVDKAASAADLVVRHREDLAARHPDRRDTAETAASGKA